MRTGTPDTMEAWMRDINRRLTRLEQEPRIVTSPGLAAAADPSGDALLGAGFPEDVPDVPPTVPPEEPT